MESQVAGQLSSGLSAGADWGSGSSWHIAALERGREWELCGKFVARPGSGLLSSARTWSCDPSVTAKRLWDVVSRVPGRSALARRARASSERLHFAGLSGEGCLPALRRSVSVLAWLERRVAVMVSAPRPGGKGASPKQTFFFGSSVSWTGMSCSFPFSPQSDRSSSCGCAVRAVLCPYDSRPLPESVLQGGC